MYRVCCTSPIVYVAHCMLGMHPPCAARVSFLRSCLYVWNTHTRFLVAMDDAWLHRSTCLTIWLVASTDTALVGQNAAASSKGVRRDPTHVVDAVSGPAHPLSHDMIVGAAPIHRASSSSVPAWNRAAQRLDGFRKRLFEASHHDHDTSLGTVARQQWDKVVRRHGNVSVVWRLPIGCDFSGFFVEVLGLLPE